MKFKRIICLIGESGSGKSTIASFLHKYGYQNLSTFTTRSRRYSNEEGHIFIDVNDGDLVQLPLKNENIAYKAYFSKNWYWAFKSQLENNDKVVIAFNPMGVQSLKENLHNECMIKTIYLRTTVEERIRRMMERMDGWNNSIEHMKELNQIRINNEISEYRSFECDFVLDTSIPLPDSISLLCAYLKKENMIQ